jgi:hypothetical protein
MSSQLEAVIDAFRRQNRIEPPSVTPVFNQCRSKTQAKYAMMPSSFGSKRIEPTGPNCETKEHN